MWSHHRDVSATVDFLHTEKRLWTQTRLQRNEVKLLLLGMCVCVCVSGKFAVWNFGLILGVEVSMMQRKVRRFDLKCQCLQADSDDGFVYLFTGVLSSDPPVYSEVMLIQTAARGLRVTR